MGDKSGIQWTDATWNPSTGCDQVSPGCDNCYALTMAKRLKGMGSKDYQRDGDPATSGPGFGLSVHPHRLDVPLRWTKPRLIFVNSMSDLFHKDVPDEFIAQVFAVMATARRHTFQVLTKRHARMRSLLASPGFPRMVLDAKVGPRWTPLDDTWWPLPNLWMGVSVEDQHWAGIRIDALADTPAAVRFISAEPLLGPLDLTRWLPAAPFGPLHGDVVGALVGRCDMQATEFGGRHVAKECRNCTNGRRISWVIAGGESGPGARPMDETWVRSLVRQCTAAGVPIHVKQMGSVWAKANGSGSRKGGAVEDWAADLRVREYPR